MGCACPKGESKENTDGDAYKEANDGQETTGRKSILSRRPKDEVEVQKRVVSMEDVNWHDELPSLIRQSNIKEVSENLAQLIADHRDGEGMKMFLNKAKAQYSCGVYAKLKKDLNMGSIHTYYSTWIVEGTPEEWFNFNMFQDKATRKKIDKSCEQFDILAAVQIDDTIYILTYLKMAKFMIIKGKENFYIKALKKIQDDENTTTWMEINTSVTHESVPLKEDIKRVNIMESGMIYVYDKKTGTTLIEGYTKVVPQVSAGMLILKPVVGKYYKSYIKNTVEGIEQEREQKKYDYENSMSMLLAGGSLKYCDLA